MITRVRKEHIVFYIGSLAHGGSERVFVNLAVWFFERGYRVSFITTYLSENEYEVPHAAWREVPESGLKELNGRYQEVMRPEESPAYVTYLSVPSKSEDYIYRHFSGLPVKEQTALRGVNLARRTKRLRDIFIKAKPDVVISANGKNNIMAVMSTVGTHIPVIIRSTANPESEYPTKAQYYSMQQAFKHAAGVVFQLKAQQDLYPAEIAKRGVVLRNSIDERFMVPRYEGEREKTVVAAGRLDRNKNYAMLINAFARVARDHADWKLIIYGDGPEMKKLKAQVTSLDLRGRVELMGYSDSLNEQLYKAGIYVLCSNEEGMPNSLVEAMALGLACISTDCPCGGPNELINDTVNGILIPVGSQRLLEGNIRRLMDNPAMANTLGENAAKIKEMFDASAVNSAWEEYVLSIIRKNEEEIKESKKNELSLNAIGEDVLHTISEDVLQKFKKLTDLRKAGATQEADKTKEQDAKAGK